MNDELLNFQLYLAECDEKIEIPRDIAHFMPKQFLLQHFTFQLFSPLSPSLILRV